MSHRLNRLIRAIESRPDEIVHSAVDDDKFLVVGLLDVLHLGHKDACVADNHSTRFQHQRHIQPIETLDNSIGVFLGMRRHFVFVADAQSAADIQVLNPRAFFFQRTDQHAVEILTHTRERVNERGYRCEL